MHLVEQNVNEIQRPLDTWNTLLLLSCCRIGPPDNLYSRKHLSIFWYLSSSTYPPDTNCTTNECCIVCYSRCCWLCTNQKGTHYNRSMYDRGLFLDFQYTHICDHFREWCSDRMGTQ